MRDDITNGAPEEFEVEKLFSEQGKSNSEIRGASGSMADFLLRRESERTPEERAVLETVRKKADAVFTQLTGVNLPETRNVVSMEELKSFKEQITSGSARGAIRIDIESSIIPHSAFMAAKEGGMIGIAPAARDGEIGHELFHGYLQREFLMRPRAEEAIGRIAENLERQYAYQRYLKDQNFVTGREMDRFKYESDPGEISAHIIDDYLDFQQEQRENLQQSILKRDVQRFARGGHDGDVAKILDEYEDHIRGKTGKPEFALTGKSGFLERTTAKKNEKELPDVSIEVLDARQKELFQYLEGLPQGTLSDTHEVGDAALKMIARIMSEQRLLEDNTQRKEWLLDFMLQLQGACKRSPQLREALQIQGVHELLGTDIDEEDGEVRWISLSPEDHEMGEDEYLKRWKEGLEREKANPRPVQELPRKLSFEEFVKDKALVEEFS